MPPSTDDLFETRQRQSIVPTVREARAKADKGIKESADHADRVSSDWKILAIGYVLEHARSNEYMLTEDVRERAHADGFEAAPDDRAWGYIMRASAKCAFIKSDGYAPAKSSNMSPKVRWKSLVFKQPERGDGS